MDLVLELVSYVSGSLCVVRCILRWVRRMFLGRYRILLCYFFVEIVRILRCLYYVVEYCMVRVRMRRLFSFFVWYVVVI